MTWNVYKYTNWEENSDEMCPDMSGLVSWWEQCSGRGKDEYLKDLVGCGGGLSRPTGEFGVCNIYTEIDAILFALD